MNEVVVVLSGLVFELLWFCKQKIYTAGHHSNWYPYWHSLSRWLALRKTLIIDTPLQVVFNFHSIGRNYWINSRRKKAPCIIFNVLLVSIRQKPCRPDQSHKRSFETLSVPWYTLPVVKISDSIWFNSYVTKDTGTPMVVTKNAKDNSLAFFVL